MTRNRRLPTTTPRPPARPPQPPTPKLPERVRAEPSAVTSQPGLLSIAWRATQPMPLRRQLAAAHERMADLEPEP